MLFVVLLDAYFCVVRSLSVAVRALQLVARYLAVCSAVVGVPALGALVGKRRLLCGLFGRLSGTGLFLVLLLLLLLLLRLSPGVFVGLVLLVLALLLLVTGEDVGLGLVAVEDLHLLDPALILGGNSLDLLYSEIILLDFQKLVQQVLVTAAGDVFEGYQLTGIESINVSSLLKHSHVPDVRCVKLAMVLICIEPLFPTLYYRIFFVPF